MSDQIWAISLGPNECPFRPSTGMPILQICWEIEVNWCTFEETVELFVSIPPCTFLCYMLHGITDNSYCNDHNIQWKCITVCDNHTHDTATILSLRIMTTMMNKPSVASSSSSLVQSCSDMSTVV